jgi:hypothetical protein
VIVRDLEDVAGTVVALSDVGGNGDVEQLAYATVENPETLYLIVDGFSGSAGPTPSTLAPSR